MRLPKLLQFQNGFGRLSGVLAHLIARWARFSLNGAKRGQDKQARNSEPAKDCSYDSAQADLQAFRHSARIAVASMSSIRMRLTRSLMAKTTGSSGIRPR